MGPQHMLVAHQFALVPQLIAAHMIPHEYNRFGARGSEPRFQRGSRSSLASTRRPASRGGQR
eukprot:6182388-Pleurochrysis_carterae.AAC.2